MSDDLVKHIREVEQLYKDAGIQGSEGAKWAGLAADRIEELEAKLAVVDDIMVRRIRFAAQSKKAAGSTSSKQREHARMHALSEALGEIRTTLAEPKGDKG